MDISIYEGEQFHLNRYINQAPESERERTIEKVKKMAEKGAMTCPFCYEKLIVRAGEQRDIHFAHLKGKTCLESNSYDTYQNQIKRENKKHSVIKEIIYDELKTQEKYKPDLKVEYGYIEKAAEKWKYYPDIYMSKDGKEFAISVITNVNSIGDENVVKTIKNRNKYFENKGLDVIWFVEERELADDLQNRVLHLWEAEYNLAIKTEQDREWDTFLNDLDKRDSRFSIFEIFGYKKKAAIPIDVKSLYYVHSVGDDIMFSVHRVILDEKTYPFRAFAVNSGYRISMSTALIVKENIILSDSKKDDEDRRLFEELYSSKRNDLYEEIKAQEEAKRQRLVEQQSYSNFHRNQSQASRESNLHISPIEVIESVDIHNVNPSVLLRKLESFSINEYEAKQLYHFLKANKNNLNTYNLNFADIRRSVIRALGKFSDPKIRTTLVEIEYL